MTVRIEGMPEGRIDEKRVRLQGVMVTADCPKCGTLAKQDLGRDGMDYPTMNEAFDLGLWCHECSHEWSTKVILKVSLELA